jgi:serine/threonine protein kinase
MELLIEALKVDCIETDVLQSLKAPHETRTFTFKTTPPSVLTAPAAELPIGAQLTAAAEFETERVLGRGGIGIVYAATDRRLHRDVAVKLMRAESCPETFPDDGLQAELVREAELTSKLEHPGVVPVYGLGHCQDGRAFYVMRLIQGDSLKTALDAYHSKAKASGDHSPSQRNLDFRNLLSRFVSICYTVAYAHNRGVIHRDIKPENIMLGKYGETLLVDWGLAMPVDRGQQARASGERTLLLKTASQFGSGSGFPIGTPAFMSPEQAEATGPLTPATDVYSLGATLYKLLTNQLPCKGKDVFEVLRIVKKGGFDRPSARNPKVPRELEAVCLKAMALSPADRYASPLELAADIEHWLADEPVSVCPESRSTRFGRWLRRHRGAALASAAGLMGLFLAAVIAAVGMKASADREHAGREENLRLAAKFASRLIANEIDLRWRILEKEAADPRLVELLNSKQDNSDEARFKLLQDWLNQAVQEYQKSTVSASWFIADRKGNITALVGPEITPEMRARAIGKNFSHRDYFHGQGKNLDPAEQGDISPIDEPTLSAVYKSTTDKNYKVAFSVPVRKSVGGRVETVGVLATTFKVGMFEGLRAIAKMDQMAAIVDTRSDYLDADKQGRQGLILHHRNLAKRQIEAGIENYRVSADFLDLLLKVRAARLMADVDPDTRDAGIDNLRRAYPDPLSSSEPWTAVAEPVVVRTRSGKTRDTGWFVVVQGS